MESVFCGINTTLFQEVHGVSALLSAAELLLPQSPQISSVFVQYAAGLVENFLVQTGSSSEHDEAYAPLIKLSDEMKAKNQATAASVERFADALMAASDGQTAIDFCRLAYLAYNSMSIFGKVPQRVLLKLSKVESMIGIEKQSLNLTFSSLSNDQDFQLSQTQENQQTDKNNQINDKKNSSGDTKAVQNLTELAKGAFAAGQMDIALSAINAAISELQK